MSYRLPTRRRAKKEQGGLNLVPILDAIFILIFFLLMSAQFVKIFEIGSDVPIVSNTPPPKTKKKPLSLTLKITKSGFTLTTGVSQKVYKRISKTKEKKYNLSKLHDELVKIKRRHKNENVIVFEPVVDLTYEEIINIMDATRLMKNTDDSIMIKGKDGIDEPTRTLFHKIMFGNLMS